MPDLTIPLAGAYNRRPYTDINSTKDQRFVNALFETINDSELGKKEVYIFKRPGLGNSSIISSGALRAVFYSPGFSSSTDSAVLAANTGGQVFLYESAANSGSPLTVGFSGSAVVLHISEWTSAGIVYVMLTADDQTGWFLASDSFSYSGGALSIPTFTGDRTSGSAVVINVSSIAGLYVGQKITATGFAVGTRIASIDSATQITMTNTASSGAPTNTTFTREALAKIINANFPTDITGQFADLDGTLYIMTKRGRVYGSNIGTPVVWTASNYFSCDAFSDSGVGIAKSGKNILGFGTKSIEVLTNGGTSFGSLLIRLSAISDIGASLGDGRGKALITNFQNKVFFSGYSGNCWMYDDEGPKLIGGIGMSGTRAAGASNSFESVDGFTISGNKYVHFMATAQSTGMGRIYSLNDGTWVTSGYDNCYLSDESGAYSYHGSQITYATQSSGTNVYKIDSSSSAVFTDNDSAYTMTIQTGPYYLNGGLPFTIDNISLIADTQSSGTTTLTTTSDDYANFVTIGSFDLTQQQKNLAGGGYYDASVAFKLTDPGNNAWRGQALKITWRPFQ